FMVMHGRCWTMNEKFEALQIEACAFLDKLVRESQIVKVCKERDDAILQVEEARRTAGFWKANHLAGNAEIEDLTKLLRRAEDALGPDRTPTDRKDALMHLGRHFAEKRSDDCREQYGTAFCGKPKGHELPHEGVRQSRVEVVQTVRWGTGTEKKEGV
ncbi:MAG: hypothetical protein ACRD1Z_20210, partial [Vicinamibacteria bacterium]